MTVYVGIVSYNSRHDLPRCLAALHAQTYADLHITLLDNSSQDRPWKSLKRTYKALAPNPDHPNLPNSGLKPAVDALIQNSENVGFGRAHNQILARCALTAGDYYMPLNPDVILMPDYIEKVVRVLEEKGGGWAIGKLRLLSAEGEYTNLIYSAGHSLHRSGYVVHRGFGQPDQGQFESIQEIFGASGAAAILSADLIAAVAENGDLYDSDMFLYSEDTDLDWRARRQGWRCWIVPQAIAYHRGSQPSADLQAQAIANRYLSVIKNAFWIDLVSYNFPLILLHCAARLILTPRQGWSILSRLIKGSSRAWQQRRKPAISRAEMERWFQDYHDHPTQQPKSFPARFNQFWRRMSHP